MDKGRYWGQREILLGKDYFSAVLFSEKFYKPFERSYFIADCATRVDILDGADLVEAVATFLTEKSIALSAMHCALECYHKNCDVAYFHERTRECRYTADSATSTSKLPCNDIVAQEHKEGVEVLDKVKRFCMRCRGFTVSESRTRTGDDNTLVQVQSNTIETKPVPVRIIHPAKPRVRLILPSQLNVSIPARPRVPLPHSLRWNPNQKAETLPTRINSTRMLTRPRYLSLDIQRVDGTTDREARPGDFRVHRLYLPSTTLRPVYIKSRVNSQRYRKLGGFSFRKDLYKLSLLPSHRTRFYNEGAAKGNIRFLRKKKRGWGTA
ncbi:hypothetical protein OESDEN_02327 [Oesophagostomum dentatum]|uniref:PAN domain protein n=1 Tax=Oesophagostomum dentatum TaxID=61180 RepID=A0A0B1TPG4_OESDE|nr:hypothetical protein OESDEN_02327 [Oesophagostomum dentatum]